MKMRQIRLLLVVAIFAVAGLCPTSVECKALDREAMDPLQTISDFAGYKRQYTISPQGVYTFYYVLPQSSRFEERTASGEVRGNYAYVAPEGEQFKFKYEAGKKGFQVESNALPSAPEDTDEVKRAKEVFFEAYQRALDLAELEAEEVKGEKKGRTDVRRGKYISRGRKKEEGEVARDGGQGEARNEKDGSDGEDDDDDESSEEDDDEESSEESSEEDDDDDESSEEDDDDDESSEEDDDDESSEEDDDDNDESSEEDDDDDESSEEDDDEDESDEDVRKSLNIRGRLKHNNQIYNVPRRRRLIRIQQSDIQRNLPHIDKSTTQNKPENSHSNIRQNAATTSGQNHPQTNQNQFQNPPLKMPGNSYFIRNPTHNSKRNPTRKRRVNSSPNLSLGSSPSRNPTPNRSNRHFNRIHNTIDRLLDHNRTVPLNRTQRRKVPRNRTGSARLRISRQPISRSKRRPTKRFVLTP